MLIFNVMIKIDVLSPDNPKYYCNYCDYQKNVNDTSDTVCKEPDGPSDDQDYCYKIK